MHCPYCRHDDSKVIDSRGTEDGQSIRRRRECPECGRRFTTNETITLNVIKRNGVAVLRFASVYRSFESLADFELEIDDLRSSRASRQAQNSPQREPATSQ